MLASDLTNAVVVSFLIVADVWAWGMAAAQLAGG
jgi:hypothetical protein